VGSIPEDHPGWWPIGFFLRRSGRGRVSNEKLGDLCAAAPSLHADPMPPRMTQESCRPRVSDGTMVGNSATHLACEFQRTEGAVMSANMKRQGGKSIQGPLLRGLAGRSAAGQNDQAAAEEMWLLGLGGWMSKKYSCRSGEEKCFSLDIPFNRTSRSCDSTSEQGRVYARSVNARESQNSQLRNFASGSQ